MTFDNQARATTAWRIETTQMELAEYSPAQLKRFLTIKGVKK